MTKLISKVNNCLIKSRDSETLFICTKDQIIPNLDGYAIIPKEEYDALELELKALREPGPCGKHPRAFWVISDVEIPGRTVSGAECGVIDTSHCTLCSDLTAAYDRGLRDAADVASPPNRVVCGCVMLRHSKNCHFEIRKRILALSDQSLLAQHDALKENIKILCADLTAAYDRGLRDAVEYAKEHRPNQEWMEKAILGLVDRGARKAGANERT